MAASSAFRRVFGWVCWACVACDVTIAPPVVCDRSVSSDCWWSISLFRFWRISPRYWPLAFAAANWRRTAAVCFARPRRATLIACWSSWRR
jgi:hypothetical protein